MKKSAVNKLLLFLVATLAYQNICVYCDCPVADVQFKLYEQHSVSLEEAFVDFVDQPQKDEQMLDAIYNEGANQIPLVGGLVSASKDAIGSSTEYKRQIEVERMKARAIIKDIKNQINSRDKFEIKITLDSLDYHLEKNFTKQDLKYVDTALYKIVLKFADPYAPAHEDPTYAASIILPLADFVESFMKLVRLEEKQSGEQFYAPKVSCKLARRRLFYTHFVRAFG